MPYYDTLEANKCRMSLVVLKRKAYLPKLKKRGRSIFQSLRRLYKVTNGEMSNQNLANGQKEYKLRMGQCKDHYPKFSGVTSA